jgi:hypothetical protein
MLMPSNSHRKHRRARIHVARPRHLINPLMLQVISISYL